MSFTNNAQEKTQSGPGSSGVVQSRPAGKRSFGRIAIVCLMVIGGGVVAYRYWGPGRGSGPQTALAESKIPAVSAVTAPVKPKVVEKEWVNPAFKDLTPQAANALRAKVAESIVTQLFNAGEALNKQAASLTAPRPKRVKPPVKIVPPKPKVKPKPIIYPSPAAAGVDPGAFRISAIMFSGANSKAVINGAVYGVGQKVSGAVVVSITPKTITLKIDETMFKAGM